MISITFVLRSSVWWLLQTSFVTKPTNPIDWPESYFHNFLLKNIFFFFFHCYIHSFKEFIHITSHHETNIDIMSLTLSFQVFFFCYLQNKMNWKHFKGKTNHIMEIIGLSVTGTTLPLMSKYPLLFMLYSQWLLFNYYLILIILMSLSKFELDLPQNIQCY